MRAAHFGVKCQLFRGRHEDLDRIEIGEMIAADTHRLAHGRLDALVRDPVDLVGTQLSEDSLLVAELGRDPVDHRRDDGPYRTVDDIGGCRLMRTATSSDGSSTSPAAHWHRTARHARRAYGAGQASCLVGMNKATALETAEDGITCNAICSGDVDTPLVEAQIETARPARTAISRESVIRHVQLEQPAVSSILRASEASWPPLTVVSRQRRGVVDCTGKQRCRSTAAGPHTEA